MFMKEHVYFDTSVKSDKFLKNNPNFKFNRDFLEYEKLATLRATTEQFFSTGSHILG